MRRFFALPLRYLSAVVFALPLCGECVDYFRAKASLRKRGFCPLLHMSYLLKNKLNAAAMLFGRFLFGRI
jgi:hypothetical protein